MYDREGGAGMIQQNVWFKDNFLSSGSTEIWDRDEQVIGELNLLSMFNSGIQVLDLQGQILTIGKFPFFSNKWIVMDGSENEIGRLSARFTLFSKKYEYQSLAGGVFEIHGQAFSSEYDILDAQGQVAARFAKVSGFFSAAAYQLSNDTSLPTEEWIAVVMGVHALQQRQQQQQNSTL
jgi:uncharacterized protein YxjI